MGVVTILLAALLLCLTAYFEKWGRSLNPNSALDSSAPAPTTEDPAYFEDKIIPEVFKRYATLHNSATNQPRDAKYVLYEIPGNSTVAHSLLGLVSAGVMREMEERNEPAGASNAGSRNLALSSQIGRLFVFCSIEQKRHVLVCTRLSITRLKLWDRLRRCGPSFLLTYGVVRQLDVYLWRRGYRQTSTVTVFFCTRY